MNRAENETVSLAQLNGGGTSVFAGRDPGNPLIYINQELLEGARLHMRKPILGLQTTEAAMILTMRTKRPPQRFIAAGRLRTAGDRTRRPPGFWLRGVFFALALAIPWSGAAVAGHGTLTTIAPGEDPLQEGELSFACGSLPEDALFDIGSYSDDDLTLEVVRAFADELSGQGHPATAGARFQVMIETQIELGRFETTRGALGRLKVKNGGVEVRFNVWSSGEGSIITGRRTTREQEANRLLITATLRDRETGEALWWGEAAGDLEHGDAARVGRTLAPALAEAFGCSVRLDDLPLED